MLNILGLIIVYTRLLEYYIQLWIVWNIGKPNNKLTGVLCMDSECHSQDLCLHFLLQGVISAFCFCWTARVSLKKTHQAHSNCTSWKQTHKLFPILAGYHVILVLIFGSYPNGLWPDQLRSQRPHSPPGASGSRSTAMAGNGGLHRLEIPKMVGL